ncbi:MAG: hypothetical protein ACREU7_16000, partial [Burkholderiales bacterium]
ACMNTSEIRALMLHLTPRREAASEQAILTALGGLEPLPRVSRRGDHLRLEYVFPTIAAADIFEALATGHALDGIRFRSRLRARLAGMLDETERERRGRRLGWHAYVENVYASYFARRHGVRADTRRQHWQNYVQ